MNTRKLLVAIPVLFVVLFSGVAAFLLTAHGVTTNTVDLTSCISYGRAIRYDSSSNSFWFSEGQTTNAIAKIPVSTVLASGCAVVTTHSSIFPASGTGVGNYASGPYGLAVLGGKVYVSAIYNSGIALAIYNPSTSSVSEVKYIAGYQFASALATDGAKIYLGTNGAVLVYDPNTDAITTLTANYGINDLVVNSGVIYMATSQTDGLVKMNTDGSGISSYSVGQSGAKVAVDSSGNIWATSNTAHWLMELPSGQSTVSHWATGLSGDGPYCVVPTSAGIQLDSYGAKQILNFATLTSTFTTLSNTTDSPYCGALDGLGNAWHFALGSFQLTEIPNPNCSVLWNYVSACSTSSTGTLIWNSQTLILPISSSSATSSSSSSSATSTSSSSSSSILVQPCVSYTGSCALTSSVSSGHLIVVVVSVQSGWTPPYGVIPSDTLNTSFTRACTESYSTSPSYSVSVFYGIAPSSGVDTVSASFGGGGYEIDVLELKTVTTIDVCGTAHGQGTTASISSISPASGDFVLAATASSPFTFSSYPSGYTGWFANVDSSGHLGVSTAYIQSYGGGATTASFGLQSSATWAEIVVGLK